MLKVGIFTPYVRNEITLAATQFADWLVHCGIDTSILSHGRVENGIHPVWDKQVKRSKGKAVYSWAYGATHLCWFNANMQALHQASLIASSTPKFSTKHIFFPYWSNWPKSCEHFAFRADKTVCLTPATRIWLNNREPIAGCIQPTRPLAKLVSPAKVLIQKYGMTHPGRTCLMVVLPRTTDVDLGTGILGVFDYLLESHKDLHLTLVLECSLPKRYRNRITAMRREYKGRVRVVTSPAYYSYVDLARQHDFVYVANTRYTYGSLLSAIASSSVPMICHDIPPTDNYIEGNVNGILIPCEVHNKSVPIANVKMVTVLDRLDALLQKPTDSLKSMQTKGFEQMKARQKSFERFIYREFVQ